MALSSSENIILSLLVTPPEDWSAALPEYDEKRVYLGRGSALCSRHPLFGCLYELWSRLDARALDRTEETGQNLSKIRMLLQLLFDTGNVDHVVWDYGSDSRWDDFWEMLHELVKRPNFEALVPVNAVRWESVWGHVESRLLPPEVAFHDFKLDWKKW